MDNATPSHNLSPEGIAEAYFAALAEPAASGEEELEQFAAAHSVLQAALQGDER